MQGKNDVCNRPFTFGSPWEQPLPIECWLEPDGKGETRFFLAVEQPVDQQVNLPLRNASGANIGYLVLAPYANLRGLSVLEAVEVRPAGCPAPGLSSAWSGALGLRIGGL